MLLDRARLDHQTCQQLFVYMHVLVRGTIADTSRQAQLVHYLAVACGGVLGHGKAGREGCMGEQPV